MLEFLEKKGVKIIVGGKIGAGMKDCVKEKGIEDFEFKGTVKEALKVLLEKNK